MRDTPGRTDIREFFFAMLANSAADAAAADAAAALEAAQIDSDSDSSADRLHDFVEAEERRLEQARHSLLTDRLPLDALALVLVRPHRRARTLVVSSVKLPRMRELG